MIFSPALTNTAQVFNITGGIQGLAQVTFACNSYPSAGTVKLEYQVTGSSQWVLALGSNGETSTQPATAQANWEVYGAISNLRLTFASLTGGSGAVLAATYVDMRGHPFGLYQGLRAITTQDYNSTNVKRGVQYEASTLNATLAAAGTLDVLFVVGSRPVIVKNRIVSTTAVTASYRKYVSPTATQGAQIPVYNLNTNGSVAVPNLTNLYLASAVSATGTEIAAPLYIVGSTGQGQTVIGTFSTNGVERVLVPNTTYLARFTNTGTSTCVVAISWVFFEGTPDLPLT